MPSITHGTAAGVEMGGLSDEDDNSEEGEGDGLTKGCKYDDDYNEEREESEQESSVEKHETSDMEQDDELHVSSGSPCTKGQILPEAKQDFHKEVMNKENAPLPERQKKWADKFSSANQMIEFVVREVLANATDAILRLGNTGEGRVDVSVREVGGKTVLLEVTDNGDGCESFLKAIMTEGTSANRKKDGPKTTGGKGSAKDCLVVQEAYTFVSKVQTKPRRYYAGSQESALEHACGCKMMDLELEENRGPGAQKKIMQKCPCVEFNTFPKEFDDSHGTTVTLALAPVMFRQLKDGRSKSSAGTNVRLKKIKDTVRRVIEYSVGENCELDHVTFTLNDNVIKPKISIQTKKLEVQLSKYIGKAKCTRFNKEFECFGGSFDGDLNGKSLMIVSAETGMYQFMDAFRTNHSKSNVLVVKCLRSCNQLDASRSHFKSEGHQSIYDELKTRMRESEDFETVMKPGKAVGPRFDVSCNGNVSSTDPLEALIMADVEVEPRNNTGKGRTATKKERQALNLRKEEEMQRFVERQAEDLTPFSVSIRRDVSKIDQRAILARHTAKHIDYLIAVAKGTTNENLIPLLVGTLATARLKLYRLYCIVINMVNNVRYAAEMANLCNDIISGDLRVMLHVTDEGGEIVSASQDENGTYVVHANLLDLIVGKVKMRFELKTLEETYKSLMPLLDHIIHMVATSVTQGKSSRSEEDGNRDYQIQTLITARKLSQFILHEGMTTKHFSVPTYLSKLHRCSIKLSRVLRKKYIPKPPKNQMRKKDDVVPTRTIFTRSVNSGFPDDAHQSDGCSNTGASNDCGVNRSKSVTDHSTRIDEDKIFDSSSESSEEEWDEPSNKGSTSNQKYPNEINNRVHSSRSIRSTSKDPNLGSRIESDEDGQVSTISFGSSPASLKGNVSDDTGTSKKAEDINGTGSRNESRDQTSGEESDRGSTDKHQQSKKSSNELNSRVESKAYSVMTPSEHIMTPERKRQKTNCLGFEPSEANHQSPRHKTVIDDKSLEGQGSVPCFRSSSDSLEEDKGNIGIISQQKVNFSDEEGTTEQKGTPCVMKNYGRVDRSPRPKRDRGSFDSKQENNTGTTSTTSGSLSPDGKRQKSNVTGFDGATLSMVQSQSRPGNLWGNHNSPPIVARRQPKTVTSLGFDLEVGGYNGNGDEAEPLNARQNCDKSNSGIKTKRVGSHRLDAKDAGSEVHTISKSSKEKESFRVSSICSVTSGCDSKTPSQVPSPPRDSGSTPSKMRGFNRSNESSFLLFEGTASDGSNPHCNGQGENNLDRDSAELSAIRESKGNNSDLSKYMAGTTAGSVLCDDDKQQRQQTNTEGDSLNVNPFLSSNTVAKIGEVSNQSRASLPGFIHVQQHDNSKTTALMNEAVHQSEAIQHHKSSCSEKKLNDRKKSTMAIDTDEAGQSRQECDRENSPVDDFHNAVQRQGDEPSPINDTGDCTCNQVPNVVSYRETKKVSRSFDSSCPELQEIKEDPSILSVGSLQRYPAKKLYLVFERIDIKGDVHDITVPLGSRGLTFESKLIDAMVEAKELRKSVFFSKTKGVVMYIQQNGNGFIPVNIKTAKVKKISELINVGSTSGAKVLIRVKDEPELDENENEVMF